MFVGLLSSHATAFPQWVKDGVSFLSGFHGWFVSHLSEGLAGVVVTANVCPTGLAEVAHIRFAVVLAVLLLVFYPRSFFITFGANYFHINSQVVTSIAHISSGTQGDC